MFGGYRTEKMGFVNKCNVSVINPHHDVQGVGQGGGKPKGAELPNFS